MSDDASAPAPRPLTKAERRAQSIQETKSDLKWATALLFVLVLAISGWMYPAWQRPTDGTEDLADVTDVIFSSGNYSQLPGAAPSAARTTSPGLVVPFEILSILLLAALVAGVVIAARDPERER